ncbi:MAG: glycosyltransferase [Bacteroidota bacterium]
MPRVLRIINRFNLGGPTYNASYLTKFLDPDYKTILIGGQKDKSEENSEFIVRNLGLVPYIVPEMRRQINPYYDQLAYNTIKNLIKEFRPDIVHTHASKAGAIGRRAAYNMKVPVIVHTFHGHVFDAYFSGVKSAIYQHLERNLAKKTTKIIALSESQKNDLVNKYKICPDEKVEIIQLGFDLYRFHENRELKRKQFRTDYLIDDNEIAIGIVGRLVPIKNHTLFLETIKYLKENTHKNIRAFIVGDGEEKSKLMDKCRQLELDFVDTTIENRKALISFTSWMKNVDYVNAGMDIIALTSLNEGTPVSLIEAQASGTPIVTTNVGGIENIVLQGKTALLSESNHIEEFGKNLLLLTEDDDLRKQFSEKGWVYVKEKFHYTRLVHDMKNLYNKLLNERNTI